jgi:hypothetical protein
LFLPLAAGAATPLPPPGGWRFDLAVLEGCLARPAEWKRGHGFPPDLARLLWPRDVAGEEAWQAVPLDRPEQALLLLAETAGGELVGLGVRAEGWALSPEPVLRMPAGGEALAALGAEARPEDWRAAWLGWCQQRHVPAAEAEACKLEPAGHRLLVRPPPRLLDRLRPALRGEAWLLAGTGRVRAAAAVELAG